MQQQKLKELKIAPATVTFINGSQHIKIIIANTTPEDWVDKQEILTCLRICSRTLQKLRSRKQIPYTSIGGGKILYYMPGILTLLEQNVLY